MAVKCRPIYLDLFAWTYLPSAMAVKCSQQLMAKLTVIITSPSSTELLQEILDHLKRLSRYFYYIHYFMCRQNGTQIGFE